MVATSVKKKVKKVTKKKVAKKKKDPKPKQTFIKDMEPESIPALDDAAEAYVAIRNERMDLTEQEVELKSKVRDLMIEHKLETYKGQGFEVRRVTKEEAIKVKRIKDDDPEDLEEVN